jgi:DNA-binding GntR family transcriptional regulator
MHKDVEFHHIYIEGCGNVRVRDYLLTIMDQNDRLAFNLAEHPETLSFFIDQHRKILEAVRAGDVELAVRCVGDHIISVKNFHFEKRYLF